MYMDRDIRAYPPNPHPPTKNNSFFIPDKAGQDGKSGNPQAGLVVDTGVCHPTCVHGYK